MRQRYADGGSVLSPQAKAVFAYLDDQRAAAAQNAEMHAGNNAEFAQTTGQAGRADYFFYNAFYARKPGRQEARVFMVCVIAAF